MRRRLVALPLICVMLAACTLSPIAQQLPTATSQPPTTSVPVASNTPAANDPTATAETGAEPTSQAPAATNAPVAATGPLDDPAVLEAAQPAPRDQTELFEQFKGLSDLPRVIRTSPLEVQVGDVEEFWVSDVSTDTNYEISARLRYAGPIVLMYVDTTVDQDISQEDIERSAKQFEEEIYARNHELFGKEISPGIDGDPRLTILNTPISGAGGYFSSADGVAKQVNRFSNQREMFVIGINSYPIGTEDYASTLAHEFQHMIEYNVARSSPSWFNEGMSTLAEDLNGFVSHSTAFIALGKPDIQLTGWSSEASQTGEHYGTSQLFLRYFYEQYAGEAGLAELIAADAGNNPEDFVPIAARKRPEIKSFADIYADWSVATLINDPDLEDGRYAYELLPGTASLSPLEAGEVITTVHQFGTDYLGVLRGPLTLNFDGAETVSLAGIAPAQGDYMWWSGRGDDSLRTLTRAFDLSSVQQATLQFATRYEIELNWDYAFVTVSADNGATWTPLEGVNTTNDDPQGANLGNGLTGVSGAPGEEPDKGTRGEWIEEQMDLTPYAGKQVLVRFWMVNDAAVNGSGMLLDNIRIPELNYSDDVEAGDGGWEAVGFARTSGTLPQQWTLRLVQLQDDGVTVETVATDEQGRASVIIPDGVRAALVVAGTTPVTRELAEYSYEVEE